MHASVHNSTDAANRYFMERYPGYRLDNYEVKKSGVITFKLQPLADGVNCPDCPSYCCRFHDNRTLTIKDWDIAAGGMVYVEVPSRRIRCRCGCTKTEPKPDWVLPKHKITLRLAAMVQRLLRGTISIKEVARICGVDWKTVKALDEAQLKEQFENIDLSNVQRLAIDEISIEKGHSYATVVLDLDDRRVLWVGKGKRKKDLEPFFKELKNRHLSQNILSVSVDMNAGFPSMVKKHLPKALLAYDLFHVMQNFTRKVLVEAKKKAIMQVRQSIKAVPKKKITKEMRQERDAKIKMLRGSEWLVVRQPDLLTDGHRSRLEQLRECNALFRDIYPLAAQLRTIWQATDQYEARNMLAHTIELCMEIYEEHDFEPLKKFAEMLTRRADGIANACLVRYGTNILEGCNNVAKVIKRTAFGFRDFEYYALKLKAAFPGRKHKSRPDAWELVWAGSRTPMGLPVTFTN